MIGTRDSTAASGGGQRQRQEGQLFLARISAKTEEIHTVWCDGVACLNGCIAWCRLRRKISSALKIKIEQLHTVCPCSLGGVPSKSNNLGKLVSRMRGGEGWIDLKLSSLLKVDEERRERESSLADTQQPCVSVEE